MIKLHIKTPLIEFLSKDKKIESNVWLKMEALQPCGSFKARGIGFACNKYVMEGAKELISSSGGNSGLAVAFSGRKLAIPVTVVVPNTTKKSAIDLIEQADAKVIAHGDDWNAAHNYAMSLSSNDSVYVHPFDDPNIWEGHASLIDEIVEDGLKPDAVVLSVGGGGLLCGIVDGLRRNNLDGVPVVAVETTGADSYNTAFLANKHIGIDSIRSVASSLGAKKVAKRAFELLNEHPIVNHVVSDINAIKGCFRFLDDHRIMVEPACGASLSTVYDGYDFLLDKENILMIVCGGVGITMHQLQQWGKNI